jgi:hypothetical protein
MLERTLEAAQKLVPIFAANGCDGVNVRNDGVTTHNDEVIIFTTNGGYQIWESSRARKGTWILTSKTFPLATVEVYVPSTHTVPEKDVRDKINVLLRSENAERKKDVLQKSRKECASQAIATFGADEHGRARVGVAKVDVEAKAVYLDHIRGTGIGDRCSFTIDVSIEDAPAVAAKLAAALATPTSSPS